MPVCDPITAHPDSLEARLRVWVQMRAQQERLTYELNILRDQLVDEIRAHGYRDENGHIRLELEHPFEHGGKRYSGLKRERRVRRTVNEERALALAETRGLRDRLFPMQPVFDEQELFVLHQEHLITEREIDDLYDRKIDWAFKPVTA